MHYYADAQGKSWWSATTFHNLSLLISLSSEAKMPSAVPTGREIITKFANCRLVIENELVEQDLWVSSATGKILRSQEVFYGENVVPDITINLRGKIVAPGLIDVQLNGAFGFNFSQIPEDPSTYGKTLRQVNKRLIQTGVTSYLPTLTSEKIEVYHQVLPDPLLNQDRLLT